MRRGSRAFLVFIVMATLTLQAFTRFLDHLPGGEASRGVRGINAALDFILVSRIGVVPATALLAALTIGLTVLVFRLGGAAARAEPAGQPTRQPTEADRRLLSNLLNGLVGQVLHEQEMIKASGQEPVVVRLVPQIPVRDPARPRSWLGGEPAMPDDVPWPMIGGAPANFLAQICCADLPADLWDGLGPREGWLAFFIHPTDYEMRVLHLADLGPNRRGPDIAAEDGWFPTERQGRRYGGAPICPGWPVDLVAVRRGVADPRRPGRSKAQETLYQQAYDLSSPGHQPFDWPSTLAMLDIAEAHMERQLATDWITPLTEQLDRVAISLADAEAASEPPANLTELRQRARQLPDLIEARRKAPPLLEEALSLVRRLTQVAQAQSTHTPFSPEAIAPIMQALHAKVWISPGGKRLPLTAHEPGAGLWAHDFEALRFDWARYVYARSPDSLPAAVRAHFEPLWRDMAAHEMAGMGHVPFKYVHDFDLAADVTLLELPSGNLIGWMFGDVDNLVLTMKKADLAAGRFNRLQAQVSN